jgi:hypothetical protein
MALATLSIDLEARLARMEQDLSRANRSLDKFGNDAKRSMGRVEDAFSAVDKRVKAFAISFGAALAVLAVNQIGNLFNGLVDGVDKLNDLADATGASVENLSALEDVAARTGTSIDTVASAMVKFNAELAAAKPGSENSNIFKKLGLDAEELKRIDPAEALLKTSQALAKFADDGDKARVVQALFGKSVKEVAPLLKDLADAGQLNATVTTEQAKAAEEFNKQISSLQKNLTDLARSALGPVLAAINQLADAFRGTNQYANELTGVAYALAVPFQAIAVLGANLVFVFEGVGRELGAIAAQASALARGDLSRARQIRGELKGDNAKARADLDALEARLLGLNSKANSALRRSEDRGFVPQTGRPSIGGIPSKDKPGSGKKDKPDIFGPEVPDALADALKRIEGADEAKLQRLRDVLTSLSAVVRGGGTVPESVFADIAEEMARLDPAARAAKDAQDKFNKAMEEGRQVYESTRTPAEVLAAEIERLNKLLQAGAINWDTYARAQFDAQERFDKATDAIGDKVKNTKSLAEELGLSFSSAFEDAIVNGGRLSDVLRGLEQDIIRIVTRKMITEPLGNALTNMLGTGGSGLMAGVGNFFGSLFGGMFADGGFLPPGKWGIAGERGPEPIFGGRTGISVQPAGGMVVHQNFTVSGAVDGRTQQQLAAAAASGLQRATRRIS